MKNKKSKIKCIVCKEMIENVPDENVPDENINVLCDECLEFVMLPIIKGHA